MTTSEFMRWLKAQGVTVGEHGKGSHLKLYFNDRTSVLPLHKGKEMKKGTIEAIKKQLGLK